MRILAYQHQAVVQADDKKATDGKSSDWPSGEPQSVRDAYDKSRK